MQRKHVASGRVSGTDGGNDIQRMRQMIEMSEELKCLRELLTEMLGHLDPRDVQAKIKLRQTAPTNDVLRLWAQESSPPAHLADQPEERPW
jgi:hypothetical protein